MCICQYDKALGVMIEATFEQQCVSSSFHEKFSLALRTSSKFGAMQYQEELRM